MKTAIVIPARYGSTRFPGKPLAKIGGVPMLQRVVEIGRKAAAQYPDCTLLVATEDERVEKFCAEIDVPCVMTSDNCPTGSDRVLEAVRKSAADAEFIFGLQGDAPFTPADAIPKMMDVVHKDKDVEVITPVIRLRWTELDNLREAKKITPFSGTTAIINAQENALWFSKNIIPAIRKEDKLKEQSEFSPIHQHIGLYGFRRDVLEHFVKLPQGDYEQLEGLEQLRLIENGISIRCVKLDVAAGLAQAGIDSPEDIERAERLLQNAG